uniref:Putative secreted protein n=1 Tax=Anopheles triannulatus TaxID=58253 RepID=A0A2M4B227_9DIPT
MAVPATPGRRSVALPRRVAVAVAATADPAAAALCSSSIRRQKADADCCGVREPLAPDGVPLTDSELSARIDRGVERATPDGVVVPLYTSDDSLPVGGPVVG